MAINKAQLAKELEPGLNALFGMQYARYENEHAEIFDNETSDRAFEEEVMLVGFGEAAVKQEGSAVQFDTAQESFTARYSHETVALAFSLTEEAVEDNLYDTLSARYTRSLARSMAYTKQVKAANILNNAFSTAGGDGVSQSRSVVALMRFRSSQHQLNLCLKKFHLKQLGVRCLQEKHHHHQQLRKHCLKCSLL